MALITDDIKIVVAITPTQGASGSSAITTSNVASCDCAGFDSVCAVIHMGSMTTGGTASIKLQQSSDDGVADGWSDILGTLITLDPDADDGLVKTIDVFRPTKRYVKLYIARATQVSTVGSALYLLRGRKHPPTQGAGVAGETHLSPIEGTA